jgi:hypothetical protein
MLVYSVILWKVVCCTFLSILRLAGMWVFVVITFCLPFLLVHDFAIISLPGSEAVKSQAAPLKPSTVEQIKNYSWPDSKSCCHYGIQ